ncbi:MAG: hypothetical protein PHD88_05065 [Firmicutes bacterium]|nr:hypothetical protein [Bacillota bacterium]MDD4264382.1 hypothetical protein [Bacillota bacterium]MDD4693757.1 hypothetical protein [Bacillota bacterium]
MSNLESKYNILAVQTSKKIRNKCGFQAGMSVILAVLAVYVLFGALVPTIVSAFRTIAAAGAAELSDKGNGLSGGMTFLLLVGTTLYLGVLGVIAAGSRAKEKQIKYLGIETYSDIYVFVIGLILALAATMFIMKFAVWTIIALVLSPLLAIVSRGVWWFVYAKLLFKKSDLDAEATMGKFDGIR